MEGLEEKADLVLPWVFLTAQTEFFFLIHHTIVLAVFDKMTQNHVHVRIQSAIT